LELGYGFSVWSLARLNAHLKRHTGIGFSEDQLGRIVHQQKFSFQRPKHTMKGKRDEAAYERAAIKLRTLKKSPRRRRRRSADLPGRNGNPSSPGTDPDVGADRATTASACARQE
jgi:hypothetical protein